MSSDFHTTHWSVVLSAKGNDTAAKAALRELCEMYYAPVLRYVQRTGSRSAEDLTHDFFARFLEGNMFDALEKQGGSFRWYLLGSVKHFLAKTRERESTAKRGGEIVHVSLPDDPPQTKEFDDAVFDRDWAQTMIDRALETLSNDATEPAQQQLLPWLTREVSAETRLEIAAELDMSDIAVKVALHRLRKKFRETIRRQIAATVRDATEINAELDHLIRALRNGADATLSSSG